MNLHGFSRPLSQYDTKQDISVILFRWARAEGETEIPGEYRKNSLPLPLHRVGTLSAIHIDMNGANKMDTTNLSPLHQAIYNKMLAKKAQAQAEAKAHSAFEAKMRTVGVHRDGTVIFTPKNLNAQEEEWLREQRIRSGFRSGC